MLTKELAVGMLSRGKTGDDLLAVLEAIVGTVEPVQEDVVQEDVNPLEDFNYAGSVHHY